MSQRISKNFFAPKFSPGSDDPIGTLEGISTATINGLKSPFWRFLRAKSPTVAPFEYLVYLLSKIVHFWHGEPLIVWLFVGNANLGIFNMKIAILVLLKAKKPHSGAF